MTPKLDEGYTLFLGPGGIAENTHHGHRLPWILHPVMIALDRRPRTWGERAICGRVVLLEKRKRPKLGQRFLILPDCQVRPGVDVSHMDWIANYIVDKRPDVIVNLGDYADMASLSKYSLGKAEAEGTRYVEDIQAAKSAMTRLLGPMKRLKSYRPEMHLTLGNHEARCDIEAENNPRLIGKISSKDLQYESFGWKVHPFLKVIKLGGIEFCHYMQSGAFGNACSTAAALLRLRQCSVVVGHNQATDMAFHPRTGAIALMAGVCALHNETYLKFQLNTYRRQMWMLNEVDGTGYFDPMAISLRWLRARYG